MNGSRNFSLHSTKGILESLRPSRRSFPRRLTSLLVPSAEIDVRWYMQPILQENYAFLRQKICLMALIESVFKRSADNRTMSFQVIAEETRLPIDEVEHLVMKALR